MMDELSRLLFSHEFNIVDMFTPLVKNCVYCIGFVTNKVDKFKMKTISFYTHLRVCFDARPFTTAFQHLLLYDFKWVMLEYFTNRNKKKNLNEQMHWTGKLLFWWNSNVYQTPLKGTTMKTTQSINVQIRHISMGAWTVNSLTLVGIYIIFKL